MVTAEDLSHAGAATDGGRFTLRQLAVIVGAAYLLTDATSIFSEFYARPSIVVAGDAARTAANIMAHPQLFRASAVADVLSVAGVVLLNLALYELLKSVHRSLARLAAFWRLAETAVAGSITASSFLALSLLDNATYASAFSPGELHGLVRLLVGFQASGYLIQIFLFGLGSTTYMYLLVKSRYVPRAIAYLAVTGSAIVACVSFARMAFPTARAAIIEAGEAIPRWVLLVLGMLFVPVLAFEMILGSWLLMKGVRTGEARPAVAESRPLRMNP